MANTGAERWRGQAVDAGVPEGSLRDPLEANPNKMSALAWSLMAAGNLAMSCIATRHSRM